ncbi:MAG: hypothetical protein ACT4P4_11060 [Betaproteobacteria bacterium]
MRDSCFEGELLQKDTRFVVARLADCVCAAPREQPVLEAIGDSTRRVRTSPITAVSVAADRFGRAHAAAGGVASALHRAIECAREHVAEPLWIAAVKNALLAGRAFGLCSCRFRAQRDSL